MSAEDKTDLPEAMIQAAVEAVQVWRREWLARVVAEPSVPSAELQRNGDVAMVEAILAAALSVCDVQQDSLIRGIWYPDTFVDERQAYRLVITTPPEEIPDGSAL